MKPTFFDFHLFPVPEGAQPRNAIKGAGGKDVWIWYQAETAQQAEMEDFLIKVFGAAKIDLAQHTRYICLTKQESISSSQLEGSSTAKFVFLFGIDGKRLGLHFQLPLYRPVVMGETAFIQVDDIAEIFEERKAGKKEKSGHLWRTLKACFNV
ncbi:MAG: hypothetical protein RIC19_06475 [Phaeodactylibacter sp.]|uniref:hypothetical protein n=1 Tax=Phaeodactylibacter sp. TaxID=1940289 RepID=UPI0032ECFF46